MGSLSVLNENGYFHMISGNIRFFKAQNARGTYLFKVRSYNMVKGKKVYSKYSNKVRVRFS